MFRKTERFALDNEIQRLCQTVQFCNRKQENN